MMTRIRTYSDLRSLDSFDDRFEYLKLNGSVGHSTFGFDRYINQQFYSSNEWKRAREFVILRDNGCDLGIPGYEIHSNILVHHINPMVIDDLYKHEDWVLNPEYLITTTHNTHNAIHYGDKSLLPKVVISRSPGDTKLW
ncbi:MAG: hypothetical protein ABWY25_07285 [Paenisporosarcina sp.]